MIFPRPNLNSSLLPLHFQRCLLFCLVFLCYYFKLFCSTSRQVIVNCSKWSGHHLPTRTTVLILENNFINSTKDIFDLTNLNTLREVYLHGNHIASLDLPDDNVSRALTVLDVSSNKLTGVSADLLGKWMKAAPGLELRLAGNPWACGCEMRPFLYFLFKNSARIKDYLAMTCAESDRRYITVPALV